RSGDVSQKGTETSLIEQFLYPKLGPGQMWETVAAELARRGVVIATEMEAVKLHLADGRVIAVEARQIATGELRRYPADVVFSTMPIREPVGATGPAPAARALG